MVFPGHLWWFLPDFILLLNNVYRLCLLNSLFLVIVGCIFHKKTKNVSISFVALVGRTPDNQGSLS